MQRYEMNNTEKVDYGYIISKRAPKSDDLPYLSIWVHTLNDSSEDIYYFYKNNWNLAYKNTGRMSCSSCRSHVGDIIRDLAISGKLMVSYDIYENYRCEYKIVLVEKRKIIDD